MDLKDIVDSAKNAAEKAQDIADIVKNSRNEETSQGEASSQNEVSSGQNAPQEKSAPNVEKLKEAIVKDIKTNVVDAGKKAAGKAAGRILTKVIIIVVAVLIVGGGIYYFINNERKGLTIDKTVNVAEEIKKIGEFTSVSSYEELVLANEKVSTSTANSLTQRFLNDTVMDELVLIAKGRVRAGFDLRKVAPHEIDAHGDTLTITLPQPEIFDVIINPKDYEIYVEKGQWKHEEVTAMQRNLKEILLAHAEEDNLLEKANEFGVKKLTALFKTFGFNKITINVKEAE